jgi:Tfp pilus assembly protein PilV
MPHKFYKAFSLGEVVLAGFVLTVGLLSISALITKSLQNSFENRDAITAILLAQEGVELVRNVRDNNLAAGGTGFVAFNSSNKHCRMSYNDSGIDCLGAGNEPNSNKSRYYLEYASDKMYKHTGIKGKFSRYIYVDMNTNGSTINTLVRSFVYWGDGASGTFTPAGNGSTTGCSIAKKCVFTEVNLTNWK